MSSGLRKGSGINKEGSKKVQKKKKERKKEETEESNSWRKWKNMSNAATRSHGTNTACVVQVRTIIKPTYLPII